MSIDKGPIFRSQAQNTNPGSTDRQTGRRSGVFQSRRDEEVKAGSTIHQGEMSENTVHSDSHGARSYSLADIESLMNLLKEDDAHSLDWALSVEEKYTSRQKYPSAGPSGLSSIEEEHVSGQEYSSADPSGLSSEAQNGDLDYLAPLDRSLEALDLSYPGHTILGALPEQTQVGRSLEALDLQYSDPTNLKARLEELQLDRSLAFLDLQYSDPTNLKARLEQLQLDRSLAFLDLRYSDPANPRAGSEQLQLSTFEMEAMFKTLGDKVADFFLGQRGANFADFTKELGGIARDFLECREAFLNGNSGGAWRDKIVNEKASQKISKISSSCSELLAKFMDKKEALRATKGESPTQLEIDAIGTSLKNFTQDVHELHSAMLDRTNATNEAMSPMSSIPQEPIQDDERYTYSPLMTGQEVLMAESYSGQAAYYDLVEVDTRLIEAEQAQQRRDIWTEKTHVKYAQDRLEFVINRLENSPKYRIYSLVRRLLRTKKPFKMQKVVDRLKTRSSLLENKVSALEEHINVLNDASLLLSHPDVPDNVNKTVGQYADDLILCEEMGRHGFSLGDLGAVDNLVGDLVDKLQDKLRMFRTANEVIAESRGIIDSSSIIGSRIGQGSPFAVAVDRIEADCEKVRNVLQQHIPTEKVITATGKIADNIAGHIGGFGFLGNPRNPEKLNDILAQPLNEDLYSALERLILAKTVCDTRNVEDPYLQRVFKILSRPDLNSAMQGVKFRAIKKLWSSLTSRASRDDQTAKGPIVTRGEKEEATVWLDRLEKDLSTNNKKGQQESLKHLRDVLATVDDRLSKGPREPYLKKNIALLWIELQRMTDSIMRSMENEKKIPSS